MTEEKPNFAKMELEELHGWALTLAGFGCSPIMSDRERAEWLSEIVAELIWKTEDLKDRIEELEKQHG